MNSDMDPGKRKSKKKKSKNISFRKQSSNNPEGSSQDFTKTIFSSLGNSKITNLLGGGFIQSKLKMSTPGDSYEKQADKVAGQVVSSDGSGSTPPKIDKIQSNGNTGNKIPTKIETDINKLKGKGSAINRSVRDYFEPRYGKDLGNVRIHTGKNAAKLADSIGARAFTYGNDIVFNEGEYQPGNKEGKRLIAHELAHVQQQNKVQDKKVYREIKKENEAMEGEPLEKAESSSKKEDPIKLSANSLLYVSHNNGIYVLPAAFILMSMPANKMFMPEQASMSDQIKWTFKMHGVNKVKNVYQVEPGDKEYLIVNSLYQSQVGNTGQISWQAVADDMSTIYGEKNIKDILLATAGGIGPGEWSPPGNQPIPFYIGNEAHKLIAEYYDSFHKGDDVVYNSVPMKSILQSLEEAGETVFYDVLGGSQLAAKPDILNLTKRHIFEIKPEAGGAGQSAALAQVAFYTGVFGLAGIVIHPGLPMEPGTSGVLPGPGGYFIFRSTAPGVILYQYFKGEYNPVPEKSPEKSPEREKKWYEWEYWEEVTGLTGAALLIYLIISEGSRLYPPRNLVPVP